MQRYNPKDIEPKWQKIWAEQKTYQVEADNSKPKSYVTAMFPYPSGAGLHVGHVRNYSITDAIARFQRSKGKNVLTTIGWDGFGLPAENYAIKTGTPPAVSTAANIVNFKSQLERLGMSYDWSRELNTTDPSYYRWTQWLFLQFFKRDLAYQKESLQWWCPICKTVLANEQVINGGYCWRHEDTLVEKKWTKQWFFKITDYADELLDGLEDVNWPEKIKAMQRNWIGRSVGALVRFESDGGEPVEVFTTRPDTLFGATFLVLAPEHPLVASLTTDEHKQRVEQYVTEAQKKSDIDRMNESREKTGVPTGGYAVNPATKERIPVWVADYVLMGYGTGAIMAVPAHDERDHAFANAFDLPIVRVVKNDADDECTHDEGTMINSGEYDGLTSDQAREKIVADLKEAGVAEEKTNYRMRDWLISRQRYWGTPIPIVHCEKDGAVAVPDDQLPILLPEVESFEPTGDGRGVLAQNDDWVNTTCPTCGGPARRETDTLDGYVCSSWYLFRYADTHNDQAPWDPAKANYWLPVDFYCGADHAVAHLLYVRFWTKVMQENGLMNVGEPIKQLVYNGYINAADGSKMSKSKGNVVDPVELIDQGYGADALRIYELFIGPYDQDAVWDPKGIAGSYRLLNRAWTLVQEYLEAQQSDGQVGRDIHVSTHRTIKRVTADMERHSFNTAVAALMEFINDLYKFKTAGFADKGAWQFALSSFAQLLEPFAPHTASELWVLLGHEDNVHQAGWPEWDENYLVSDTITVVVQVNGKLRTNLQVAAGTAEAAIIAAAKADPKVQAFLSGEPKKTVYVPGKLVNFVV